MTILERFERNNRLRMAAPSKYNYPDFNPNKGLWKVCDNCKSMLYVRFLKQKVCSECCYHLEMSSTERIELLIDPGTWQAMEENLLPYDVLEFVDKKAYSARIKENQLDTGLTDAVQIGIGTLNNRCIALGVMDFQFMGGSMGSVVGEKLTRLIEYATRHRLPVVIVCASGGARMQEGTLSLMQMAKIASVLHVHQKQEKLLYISILTHPTTGGVTASFGMLGDIIIAEPGAYIAFAGDRVVEDLLGEIVPDGVKVAESLLEHGFLDLIVPRAILKGVLGELFDLYSDAPCYSSHPDPESSSESNFSVADDSSSDADADSDSPIPMPIPISNPTKKDTKRTNKSFKQKGLLKHKKKKLKGRKKGTDK